MRWQTWLGFYDHLLRWDRVDRTWWFESLWTPERDAELARRQEELTARLTDSAPRWNCRGNYRAGLFTAADATSHLQTVERCISHIRAGDLFQVNAAQRLEADFTGSTIDLFADVSEQLQPARAAYADTGSSVLAGFSPELFLHRRGRTVTTSPIKGTRPRVGVADEHEADVLRGSAKDAAENVMIVDLMRNDLGRVGLPGSVRAPSLLDIEPHPGVWHLVSTVTAELPDEVDDADLLAATFPPGSVTGAPKSSAMRIIDRYEPGGRQAFSGAVGFSSPVYGAEFAVTIRSFQIADDRVGLWVGGGITVDSVPIEEWRECLTKASPLL
ncbi:MAG TPA: chorismate-binding protein, partial [Mycobacteriales bacterium]|nr:chorismate-binding protein [Mycobacteriales bacterium]